MQRQGRVQIQGSLRYALRASVEMTIIVVAARFGRDDVVEGAARFG